MHQTAREPAQVLFLFSHSLGDPCQSASHRSFLARLLQILKNSEYVPTPRLWDRWFFRCNKCGQIGGTSALLALQLHLSSHSLLAFSAHLIQLTATALLKKRGVCAWQMPLTSLKAT